MDLTAHAAAATLRDLEGVEETLTARTAGLTNMVWGIASPLIFLTYGTAAAWIEPRGLEWLYALLWMPGVALGMTLTSLLWVQHAVRLHQEPGGAWRVPAYLLAFFALAAVLWVTTERLLDWHWTTAALMTIANGLFAYLVTAVERRSGVPCGPGGYTAGTWMVLAGIALGATGAGHTAASLLGAAATALGWTGAGLWMLRRG